MNIKRKSDSRGNPSPKEKQQAGKITRDHTICKAMVAERSVFFVILPFFRFLGDAGLRTVSADISRDEQIHVATNSLGRELGLFNYSNSLDKLRKATMNWMLQPPGVGTTR